jgi:hypothetical protein
VAAQKDYFALIFQQLQLHRQQLTALVCTAAWYDCQDGLEHSTGCISDQLSVMGSTLHQALWQQVESSDLLQHKLNATLQSASAIKDITSITARQIHHIVI